jgi:hypothetical protein
MKKIAFIAAFMLVSLTISAQEPVGNNIIKISPLGLVNKVRLHYEHAFGNTVSGGLTGSAYYGWIFQGVKAEPFGRLYTSGTAPEGFYLQGKINGGAFSSKFPFIYVKEVYNPQGELMFEEADAKIRLNRNFTTVGGGAGLGYQKLAGKKKNIAIDFYVGANYNTYPTDLRTEFREKTFDESGNTVYTTYFPDYGVYVWYLTGPGSVINSSFAVGYVF